MWFGFAVRHIAKKATIAAAVVAGVILSTKSGRKAAKVILAGARGAGEAAYNEIKAQRVSDPSRAGLK